MGKSLSVDEKSTVERPVLRWARKRGWLALKLNLQGNRGWPDALYLFQWPFIAFLEFKRLGLPADPLQEERIRELQARGYPAGVFDNVDAACHWLEATYLSIQGGGPGSVPGVSGAAVWPWTGQDERGLCDSDDPKKDGPAAR